MSATRLTITLDAELARRTREASGGNVSRFVSKAILTQLEEERRRKLREELIAGCIEHAEEDLAICHEWRWVDHEMAYRIDDE